MSDSRLEKPVVSDHRLIKNQYLTATSGNGWIQHMLGLTTYFRVRHFEPFKEPYVIHQFEGDRFSMIVAAIAARHPTCLSSEAWRTQPWIFAGKEKRPRQHLLDHTSRLPRLYLDFIDYIKTTDLSDKAALSLELEWHMNDLLRNLHDWELQWLLNEKSRVEVASLSEAEKRKYPFDSKMIFDDIDDAAFTFMIYNATVLLLLELWKTLRKAQAAIPTNVGRLTEGDIRRLPNPDATDSEVSGMRTGDDDTTPTTASLMSQARKAALDICRTLPLYETTSGTWVHAIQLVVPVRMALIVYRQEHESAQAKWLEVVMQQIGECRRGWAIGKYIMQGYGYY